MVGGGIEPAATKIIAHLKFATVPNFKGAVTLMTASSMPSAITFCFYFEYFDYK